KLYLDLARTASNNGNVRHANSEHTAPQGDILQGDLESPSALRQVEQSPNAGTAVTHASQKREVAPVHICRNRIAASCDESPCLPELECRLIRERDDIVRAVYHPDHEEPVCDNSSRPRIRRRHESYVRIEE